jgi:hypothetical protein
MQIYIAFIVLVFDYKEILSYILIENIEVFKQAERYMQNE